MFFQEQEKRKKAREMAKKMEEKQREATKLFRLKIEKKISEFSASDENRILLPPMTVVKRQVTSHFRKKIRLSDLTIIRFFKIVFCSVI